MRRRHFACCLAASAVLLLTGCGTRPLSQEQSAAIRSTGVVWLVPEVGSFEKLGFTVFGNERGSFRLGEPLAPDVLQVVRQRLATSRPAWRVESLQYDAAALSAKMRSGGMVMSSHLERIESDLAALAARHQVDSLLVFSPVRWDNAPYFGSEGIGVWRRALPGLDDPILHANFSVAVVDTRGRIVASGSSVDHANPIRITEPGYARQVPTEPGELGRLQRDLRSLALRNVAGRLQEVGL